MSDFAIGLQVYNANNIFLFSKMDYPTAKLRSEIGCVNKPFHSSNVTEGAPLG
jgi:hypothetical protein